MSLLLEALKKAELAKQSIKPARTENPDPPRTQPVITRENLPDITLPLEILAHDLPSASSARAPQPELSLAEAASPAYSASPYASPLEQRAAEAATGDTMPPAAMQADSAPLDRLGDNSAPLGANPSQAAARQMFEVKEMDYNPRRPFYITLGVLVLCGAGYGGYVWWQMQPRSLYNAAAAKTAPKGVEETPSAAPPASPAPTANAEAASPGSATTTAAAAGAQQSPSTPATTPAPQVTGQPAPAPLPTGKAPTQPAPPQQTAPQPGRPPVVAGNADLTAAQAAPVAPAGTPRRTPTGDGSTRGTRSAITVAPPRNIVDPQIERAYTAFQKGDLATARDQYQKALQQEPSNRDALLGLAAIDTRTRDFELAESRYIRLLESDPRDAYAMAGLISLRGNIDPIQAISRLKTLIASQPEVGQLHFTLGNQFAAQRRWPDAQAAYFKAYSLEPENPDFAFNLAISLDQMHQTKPALEYYRRALTLSEARAFSFDKDLASRRISELARQ